MVIKLQDGSLVMATDLLNGEAISDEGKPLKFVQVLGATIPTFDAISDMSDGSGRVNVYSFGLHDTKVRVSVIQKTKEEMKAEKEQATVVAAKREEDAAAAKAQKEALEATQQQKQLKTEKAFKTVSTTSNQKKIK